MFMVQAHKIEGEITTIHSSHEERTMAYATVHLSRTIDHLVTLALSHDREAEVIISTIVKRQNNLRAATKIWLNSKLAYTIEVTEI